VLLLLPASSPPACDVSLEPSNESAPAPLLLLYTQLLREYFDLRNANSNRTNMLNCKRCDHTQHDDNHQYASLHPVG
jgi:hypothetical protein